MPTDEIIIRLFCMVDDALRDVNNRPDAHLHPSEVVTIGLPFSLKGGRYRPFYRWLYANYRDFFPGSPHLTRLLRLLRDYAPLTETLLAQPSFFTVVDIYGIELIHPRRQGRSKRQLGKKGKSNGRWIVGIKLAWLINNQGEVVDWAWATANEADNTFRPLALGYDRETMALADLGFREKDAAPSNIHCCERGTWNERFTSETNLSWVSELFDAKKMYHRVKSHMVTIPMPLLRIRQLAKNEGLIFHSYSGRLI